MNAQWQAFLTARGASFDAIGAADFNAPKTPVAPASLHALMQEGLIRFTGDDAQAFLHGQLSCDVNALGAGQAQYGSYCTPQGRMLASFVLWRDDAGYWMALPRALVEATRKRLAMFILRSKVLATDASDTHVLLGVSGARAHAVLSEVFPAVPDAPLSHVSHAESTVLKLAADRFEISAPVAEAQTLWDAFAARATPVGAAAWEWLRIREGIASITPETREQFVPQMANLDAIGGVSLSKGCYPGQEIVARMHYLGKLKQRMYRANIVGTPPPKPGDKLYSAAFGAQSCGMIVNAAPSPQGGHDVLAVMQIESAGRGDVRLSDPGGPALNLLDLPYAVTAAA